MAFQQAWPRVVPASREGGLPRRGRSALEADRRRRPWCADSVLVEDLGAGPVRDLGSLESAAHRPGAVVYGQEAYPGLDRRAAALLDSVVGNHPVVDGNKRLGWLGVVVLYGLNDVDLDAAGRPGVRAGDGGCWTDRRVLQPVTTSVPKTARDVRTPNPVHGMSGPPEAEQARAGETRRHA